MILAEADLGTNLFDAMSLSFTDWAICAIYLLVTLSIAVYATFSQKNMTDYFLAGGKMHWIIAALSMSAAGFSTVSFIGGPGEAYVNGMLYWLLTFFVLALLPIAILLFLKTYFGSGQTFTVYEFLEKRFNRKVRLLSSWISLMARLFSNGVILYGAAQLLEAMAGWSPVMTCFVLGVFVLIYSTIGGLKGVMLNDMVQAITFNVVIAIFAWKAFSLAGANPLEIMKYASENSHFFNKVVTAQFYTFDLHERLTVWTMLAIALFSNMVLLSADQVQIQQLLATGGYRNAIKALLTRYLLQVPLSFILSFSGIAMFYYYRHNPQALPQGGELDANHVMGYFVSQELFSPFPGLIVAGLLAAMMSTLAAANTSMATIVVKDFLEGTRFMPKREDRKLLVSRFSTAFFGMASICLAIFMQIAGKGVTDNLIEALTVWGTLWFTLLVAYLFGTQTKWMRAKAMWYSMLCGIIINLSSTWFLYYNSLPAERISYIWIGWPGFILTIILACVLNFIFEKRRS